MHRRAGVMKWLGRWALADHPGRGQSDADVSSEDGDPFVTGTPLETIPSTAAKVWPPGEDMGDLTPVDDDPQAGSTAPPVRVITIERQEDETARGDSGGADPSRPIGRGNPPRAGQQHPGAPSRNPAGRPPGIPNPDRFSRFLAGKVTGARADGKKVQISRTERLMEMVAQDAANGDPAMRRLLDQILADERERDQRRSEKARQDALRAERVTAPLRERLEQLINNSVASEVDLLSRLQDRGIVTREPIEIAAWMKTLIVARTD